LILLDQPAGSLQPERPCLPNQNYDFAGCEVALTEEGLLASVVGWRRVRGGIEVGESCDEQLLLENSGATATVRTPFVSFPTQIRRTGDADEKFCRQQLLAHPLQPK
jgi:hypothetical protein